MINIIKQKFHNLISDKKFSEILTGSFWALSARVLSASFGVIISIIIARRYGAEILGIVAVLNSFLILATIFTVLGTSTSILRLIPEHLVRYSATSAFKIYRKTQYFVIVVSLITGTAFFSESQIIAEKLFSKPYLSFYIALAAVFVVFKSLMILNTQAVRSLRLIRVFAILQAMPQGFNLTILILIGLIWSSKDVPVYALLSGYTLTGVLGWCVMEYSFKRKITPEDNVRSISLRQILSISLPMLMTASMTFIIGQTGVILLGMFRSEAEVGYYAIAVKLATLTAYILQAVNSMVGPKFSELFHSGKLDELFYVAKKSAKLIFYTTTPVLLGLVIFGKIVLGTIFGNDFKQAYLALVLLVMGQFIHSISGATGLFMNMTGSQKVLRNIMLLAALLNIGVNIVLIPEYGIYGAAVAAMVSISLWNIITLIYIKYKFGKTTGYLPIMKML